MRAVRIALVIVGAVLIVFSLMPLKADILDLGGCSGLPAFQCDEVRVHGKFMDKDGAIVPNTQVELYYFDAHSTNHAYKYYVVAEVDGSGWYDIQRIPALVDQFWPDDWGGTWEDPVGRSYINGYILWVGAWIDNTTYRTWVVWEDSTGARSPNWEAPNDDLYRVDISSLLTAEEVQTGGNIPPSPPSDVTDTANQTSSSNKTTTTTSFSLNLPLLVIGIVLIIVAAVWRS